MLYVDVIYKPTGKYKSKTITDMQKLKSKKPNFGKITYQRKPVNSKRRKDQRKTIGITIKIWQYGDKYISINNYFDGHLGA